MSIETASTTFSSIKEPEPLTLRELQKVFSMLPVDEEPPYHLVIFASIKHARELKRRIADSTKEANPLTEDGVMIHVKKHLKKMRLVKVPKLSFDYRSLPKVI